MAVLLELDFHAPPTKLYSFHREYLATSTPERTPNSNFLRGVKWSPDGACFLTASDDNCLRIYDTPLEALQLAAAADTTQPDPPVDSIDIDSSAGQQLEPAGQRVPAQLPAAAASAAQHQQQGQGQAQGEQDSFQPAMRIQEGELLYDYCWYSRMAASDPASCCLATTGRAQPIHLWDACTGELRCTYRAYNDLDEVAPAHSLAFSLDGANLYCGFNKAIRHFRVDRPGRDCSTIMAYKKGAEGLPGIVSCVCPNPDRSGMLAAGSYSGAAALLDPRTRELLCVLEGGHAGGLTHLCFSADGNFLYTGARKDPHILCWDVRYSSGVLYSLQRQSGGTNQRMYFDIEPCGRHLATGGEDGIVRVFDLRDGSQAAEFVAAGDTVNGVHFHPFLPLLATASGQRRYPLAPADSDSDSESDNTTSSSTSSDSGHEGPTGSSSSSSGGSEDGGPLLAPLQQPQQNVLQVWQWHTLPVQQAVQAEEVGGVAEEEVAAGAEAAVAAQVAAVGAAVVVAAVADDAHMEDVVEGDEL